MLLASENRFLEGEINVDLADNQRVTRSRTRTRDTGINHPQDGANKAREDNAKPAHMVVPTTRTAVLRRSKDEESKMLPVFSQPVQRLPVHSSDALPKTKLELYKPQVLKRSAYHSPELPDAVCAYKRLPFTNN